MNRLSPKIIKKLAGKLSKSEKYVREQISKRARKDNTPSEVALVKLANEYEIPTSAYVRKLGSIQQEQVYAQPPTNNSVQRPQIQRIILFGKNKNRWYNLWWIQWFVVGLLIATISGTFSQIIGTYYTNLLGLTNP